MPQSLATEPGGVQPGVPWPDPPRPGPGSGVDLMFDGDPTTFGLIDPDPAYPPILVLGRDTCEDTIRSRDWMDSHGIPYVYRNVELDPEADAKNRKFNDGNRVTPVILVGNPEAPSTVLIEPSDEELAAAIGVGV
ncbi:MAG TPA: glutaredoxin family protein [Candidatus Binatia bacterium]|nr:glutaredoxin family protein [Candidatus Binatia bacterium]